MVREFPVFHPPAAGTHGWDGSSNGFHPAASVKAQVDNVSIDFNFVYPPALISCGNYRPIPTLGFFFGDNPLKNPFTLLLLEVSFIILTTRVLRFLLKPLKQPRIVSEVIGGMFIGPSILGRSEKFTSIMFPVDNQFLVRNIGAMGFTYYFFLAGVKMDLSLVRKTSKKQLYIAIAGVALPCTFISIVAFSLRKSMDKELARLSSIGFICTGLALPLFPVLHSILKELNLLSSEIGRLGLSIAVISDAMGVGVMVIFEAAKQGEGKALAVVWYLISLVGFVVLTVFVIRRALSRVVEITPDGKPVDQAYVVAILLGVLIMGFLADMFGIAIANGAFWLGLAIPDGPPLGSTLVERSETVILEVLMPFSFAFVGLYVDVNAMSSAGWSGLGPLFAITMTGYVSKFLGTLITSAFFELPIRDGVVLSFIMILRGQVEIVVFLHWMDKKIIEVPGFTLMVLAITSWTAIATPLISILYDPTRPYQVLKRRTIQHTPPEDSELRILLCIYDEDSTAALINLLEISNPTLSTPFVIFALRLIDLVGRASPVLIDHEKQEDHDSKYAVSHTIHNAWKNYQESKGECIEIHPFTAIVPNRTMYQDICDLALVKKATLIILPFHKECLDTLGGKLTELVRLGVRSVNSNVINHAPCSVGVLVDKGHVRHTYMAFRNTVLHFAVLFLGGADAREALCYADRMAGNLNVSLTVIRFLSHNSEGDDEMEKKMDDGVVTWFWVKNERNERVSYREVVVRNGEETIAAIQAVSDDNNNYDVWIVGRKQGINPVLLEGLSNWSENDELGIIGDFVSSYDFGGTASVLVVQQQVLRGQGADSTSGSSGGFPCNPIQKVKDVVNPWCRLLGFGIS
ncbi:cation/H(+) antiporter 24 [Prunus avium]|uniref:Cation/H(+) antiporter 24 n=1 Tax=Prunus avium TaxID=42229 RepID=A0A6P5S0P6_PRUAV|nr:cation/H(+) antiporter 24 [Prunus avium]